VAEPRGNRRLPFLQRLGGTLRNDGPEWILRARVPILAVFCLLIFGAAYGALHLGADFSIDTLFLSKDEDADFFEAFKERFEESGRDIIVLLHGEGLFSTEALTLLARLTGALEGIDGIEKVVTVLNAPSIHATEDGIRIEPLGEKIPDSPSAVEALKQKALSNRIFHRSLVSESGTTLALVARLAPFVESQEEKTRVVEEVMATTHSTVEGRFPVYFSGFPVIEREMTVKGLRDTRLFMVLSGLILCFFLFITFRSAAGMYLPLAVVVAAVLFLLGLMWMAGQKINLINMVIPSVLLVYGIADSIHLLHRYYEELGKGGSKREALVLTIRHMFIPCFLTSFTTAAGFLSLTTATIQIVKDFGLFSGIGIMLAFVVNILLLPILLSFHPAPKREGRIWKGEGAIERVLKGVGLLNERFPRVLLSLGGLLLVGSALMSTRVNIESYVLEELKEDNPVVQANRLMEEEMSGVFSYQVQVTAGEEEGGLDPEFLRHVDELESFIAGQPWIRKTLSVVDLLKEMHQAMNGGDPAFYRVPETRELVAQYLLLYGMSGDQEDLDLLITPDHSILRISSMGVDMGTTNFFKLKERTERMAAGLFVPPVSARVTGKSLVAQNALNNIIHDMLTSLFTAFLIISATISILYRSLKLGMISMVPNVIPLVFTLGFMGFFGIHLRTATVIIFSVSLGIAVDDTIHYISRFREEYFRTGDDVISMYGTLKSAGRAIVLTTLIMISGFSVFLVSNFKASQDFGLLASITLLSSLLGTFLFLPAFLNRMKPWKTGGKRDIND
jgi:hydrophobe/amphiphile efflux-3 (HAE3) family protein